MSSHAIPYERNLFFTGREPLLAELGTFFASALPLPLKGWWHHWTCQKRQDGKGAKQMTRGSRPQKEVDITLNEIHWLAQLLVEEKKDPNPYTRQMAESLQSRLISVWGYWDKRTNTPESFALRLKRP